MSDERGYSFRGYTDFYEIGEVEGYADLIIDEVGRDGPAYPGIDLSPHRDTLTRMIVAARMRFLDEDDDARRRASPDRPDRRLERNWDGEDDTPIHDYSEFQVDDPDAVWEAWWDEIFAKRRELLPGGELGERARNPGWFRAPGHGGAKLMKPPLVSIYFLANRFFRRVLGVPFFPIFKANDHAASDIAAMPHLNPAARLFLLMAQAVDERYTREHCKRVHDDCYHLLGPEGREISHHRP